jgi:MFS transporter, MCT family, solute carrier family 16 (monocarboxylic acid transporters), member 14
MTVFNFHNFNVSVLSFHAPFAADGVTYTLGIFYVEFLDYFKSGKAETSWIASILVGVTLCSGN